MPPPHPVCLICYTAAFFLQTAAGSNDSVKNLRRVPMGRGLRRARLGS
nr:MAG TPA: hypothetical protein [Inoviridae sp.]